MTFKPGDLVKYQPSGISYNSEEARIEADKMSPLFLVLGKKINRFSGLKLRILNIRNNACGWYRATMFIKVEK